MESLINKKNMDDLFDEALIEYTQRTELVKNAKKLTPPKSGPVIRIDLPVDDLLVANRKDRTLFFKKLIKDIKARLELIRIERRLQ